MRSFFAFLKKEILDSWRGGRFTFMFLLFVAFGIMNPAIAKMTPWIIDLFSETLADSGMQVTEVKVDALTSWTQFYKNIPMALVAFVLSFGGSFTKEYDSGTLVLVLTKGMQRYKVVLAKLSLMLITWTGGYWICYGITYLYNAYYWDNGIASGLVASSLMWYLFGVFAVCLVTLFSTISRGYSTVLIGTGGVILVSSVLAMIPKLKRILPIALTDGMGLLVGAEDVEKFIPAILLTIMICIVSILVSVTSMQRKQL